MFSKEQLADLAQLHQIATEFDAELVIIGATALLCFIDLGRFTRDIDLVAALDLEDFAAFSQRLLENGWTREERAEHRWNGPRGSIIDLIPAGSKLRIAGRIVWPGSNFEMSLAAFEHVFARASKLELAPGRHFSVAPPEVVALLKIVAYNENPNRRRKDLEDFKLLLREYEHGSDRLFSGEVFDAALEDIEFANAYLLGLDIGKLTTAEEAAVVDAFLTRALLSDADRSELDRHDPWQRSALQFQTQLRAFREGFQNTRR